MNKALQLIPTYLSKYISDKVSKDSSIVNLSIGEPFFKPPEKAYLMLSNLLNVKDYKEIPNKYADSRGSYLLRAEIAKRYNRLYNATIDESKEILITHGAAEAIWLLILTLTNEGDEIIIPDPSYTLYETAARFLGRVPIKLTTNAKNGFCLEVEAITDALTTKTKLLIINSPENPTGAVYDIEKILEIHNLAHKNNFFFVHDEVYDSFVYKGAHQNIFKYQNKIDSQAVLINSFSKRYSMMGWRLGWMIADKNVIDNATKVHTNLTLNLGSFHQDAAASLLNDMEVEKQTSLYVNQIARNIESLFNAIINVDGMDLYFGLPKAGFFLFPNVSGLYKEISNKYKKHKTTGEAVMEYLLDCYKIATVPGYIYGSRGNDFIRFVAAVDESLVNFTVQRLNKFELANQL